MAENIDNKSKNVSTENVHINKSSRDNYDSNKEWFAKTRNIIYYFLGVIEVLLIIRLIFRSLGANTNNVLVSTLYSFTNLLVFPFVGIFRVIMPTGTSQYVIEPATILAMAVYALIAYGIVRLIRVSAFDD